LAGGLKFALAFGQDRLGPPFELGLQRRVLLHQPPLAAVGMPLKRRRPVLEQLPLPTVENRRIQPVLVTQRRDGNLLQKMPPQDRNLYPAYSCLKSPQKFTQPQRVACLVVKEFLRLDYRGMATRLEEWAELRQVLGLKRVPHFTTLCAAHKRLFRKPQADRLMDQVIRQCGRRGLLSRKSPLAAIDSTGLESRHVSHYFTHRCQRQSAHWKRRYPKLSAICDALSHLVLGAVFDRGPKVDHCEFEPTLRSAVRRQRMTTLVGDAGYDSEPGHRLCRHTFGIRSIFPVTCRGRLRHDGQPRVTGGTYRRRLFRHFPKEQYGQRWQIETTFSIF